MRKLILILSFAIGLYFISSSLYMLMKAELSVYLINHAWQKTLKDKQYHKPWTWADTFPILTINIPRLNQMNSILEK